VNGIFRGSLRRKLFGVVMATTLVALVIGLGSMIAFDLRAYHQGWVSDVDAQAELLARTTAPALEFDDARMAAENLAFLRFQPKVLSGAVYDARGQVFATYNSPGKATAIPSLPAADGILIQSGELLVFKRIVSNGQILGTVYLRTQYELHHRIWNYAGIALVVAVIALAIALLVSHWLQRIITRPILAVGEAAREVVERRDYSRRVQKTGDAEVAALADAFNAMMREIEQRTLALEATNRDKEREVEDRRVAQQEVMRLNGELERRVFERTAQLERSNSDLVLATAAAREANVAKSDFLSNMSHELRTPLNAIIGFGQLLGASGAAALTAQRRHDYVEHIVEAGRHLLTLINDILNLSQIEAGRLTVSVERVSLAEVLAECLTMTRPMAEARSIRLLFQCPEDVVVRADRTRLKQVLLNLLSNAVKYNRDLGSVVVDCACTSLGVRISVQDTGIGMNANQLESLFQPFNRLGQETGVQEGTGIGLVLTKRLVELMKGTLGVSSSAGTGTVFWIDLENANDGVRHIDEASRPENLGAKRIRGSGAKSTVLCVEDNPASRELIEELMSGRDDIELLTAPNGRVGLEMARAHLPDVILMDNNMPVMTGREAHALLQEDPRTASIPIIAISANAMADAVSDGLAAGFFRYLTKPIEFSALMEALDSALESRKG
jgi:signal transduction histidine kinase/CheY-like chemotaxis protein